MNLTNLLTKAVGDYMLNNPCCTMAYSIKVQIPSARTLTDKEFNELFLEDDCNLYHEVIGYLATNLATTVGIPYEVAEDVAYEMAFGLDNNFIDLKNEFFKELLNQVRGIFKDIENGYECSIERADDIVTSVFNAYCTVMI